MGFLGALDGGLRSGHPIGLAFGIAVSPLTAVGGAIYGAIAAESPEKVEQAALTLDRALTEVRIQETLRDLVIRRLAERGVDVHTGSPDSIDSVIETHVSKVGLLGLGGSGINPKLVLQVVSIVAVSQNGVETSSKKFIAGGGQRKFLAWAADDAQPFRKQVARELDRLAEKMVDDLLSRPGPSTTPSPTAATSAIFCRQRANATYTGRAQWNEDYQRCMAGY
jgi:hypothetical protein